VKTSVPIDFGVLTFLSCYARLHASLGLCYEKWRHCSWQWPGRRCIEKFM